MTEHDRNRSTSLDPSDWAEFRAQGHRMLDDMVDFLSSIRERAVWQPIPPEIRSALTAGLPRHPTVLAEIYEDFQRTVLPYGTGNLHPGFFGWVHGAGTPGGMLADMLASGLNPNLGGRDHAANLIERQVIAWACELFGFPVGASGVLVTGTSLANLIALLVARVDRLGPNTRQSGIAALDAAPVAYCSAAAHGCIDKAMDIAGLGTDALRRLPTTADGRFDVDALRRAIQLDRADGKSPFFLVGSAGTVDTGAIDDLAALADIAAAEGLWFHVDGAFGALAVMAPELKPRLAGLERADSLAFDFHKWAQVPYDAGCVLIRDEAKHRAAFETAPAYLARAPRGAGAGAPWFCDFGPDLSRGFRALKVWFTLREHGTEKIGRSILHCCRLATYLASAVDQASELELLAPVSLNIVCFRYRNDGLDETALDRLNADIVMDVQESGEAVPSTTRINGRLAIRAAIINHRSEVEDLQRLVTAVRSAGQARCAAL